MLCQIFSFSNCLRVSYLNIIIEFWIIVCNKNLFQSLGDGLSSPNIKKDRKKFGLKKKKSSKGGSVDLTMTFNMSKSYPADPDNTSPLSVCLLLWYFC